MATAQERAAELRAELAQAEAEAKAERRTEREERRRKEREETEARINAFKEENCAVTAGDVKYWVGASSTGYNDTVEIAAYEWDSEQASVNLTQDELKAFIAGLQKLVK